MQYRRTEERNNRMSKKSYARGFFKVAESHGIDPVALSKIAQDEGYSKADLEEYARHIGDPKYMNRSLRDIARVMSGPVLLDLATRAGSALSGSDAGLKPTLARAAGNFANIVGMITAAITKRRTIKEQIEADKSNRFLKMIPGIAGYEMWKGIGVDRRYAKGVKEEKDRKGHEKAAAGNYGFGQGAFTHEVPHAEYGGVRIFQEPGTFPRRARRS